MAILTSIRKLIFRTMSDKEKKNYDIGTMM
jgi:hypothetical protein